MEGLDGCALMRIICWGKRHSREVGLLVEGYSRGVSKTVFTNPHSVMHSITWSVEDLDHARAISFGLICCSHRYKPCSQPVFAVEIHEGMCVPMAEAAKMLIPKFARGELRGKRGPERDFQVCWDTWRQRWAQRCGDSVDRGQRARLAHWDKRLRKNS